MSWFGHLLGRCIFWITLPGLWLLINGSRRSRMLIIYEDTFLAVKPWLGSGHWMLPGGGIGPHEPDMAAVLREVAEETSITLQSSGVIALGERPFRKYGLRYTNVFFAATVSQPQPVKPRHKLEIASVAWLSVDQDIAQVSPEISQALDIYLSSKY